ncbi:glycosyltransferase family 4 protein [Salipiger sp. PrR004]|uniref:glycosyltransferase family 4 protein n=1 Tax=Salipiger sp. PrR002 TaxID=2706489 RepID=UPI001F37330E
MKIALILETSGGGSGRHVLDLAAQFLEYGHEATVFWSPVRAEDDFVERLEGLTGVRNVSVELHRSVGLHDLAGWRRLTAALQAHGPFDVLHAHSSKAGALVRMLPRRVPGLRLYTPHGLRTMDPDISAFGALIYGAIERLLAMRGDPVIAVSAAELKHAMHIGLSPMQVIAVANGAAPRLGMSRTEARAAFGADDSEVVIGFAGRMVEQKDPLRFVEAIRLAAPHIPNLRAVMMGDGPLMQEVRRRAGDAPVTFMGWCDAPALMNGLDLLCVTSRYEALPYSFLEALHAGVPILSTAVGGVDETILGAEAGEKQTGVILPMTASGPEIAKEIIRLASDADLRQSLCRASLALAAERTVETMTRATLEIYQRSVPKTMSLTNA